MAKSIDVRFGTFGEKRSVGVYAHDWWFLVASDVRLEGEPVISSSFADYMRAHVRSVPPALSEALANLRDAAWLRGAIPIALQCEYPASTSVQHHLVDLGLLAVMATRAGDVVYPFLCQEHAGCAQLAFSGAGPDARTRDSIASAFWSRFFWGQPTNRADA